MAAVFTILGLGVPMSPAFFLSGVLVTFMLVSALISRWRNRELHAFMASMPGPKPIPFVGTLYVYFGLKLDSLSDFIRSYVKQYPRFSAQWLGNEPCLVTGDLEMMNAVLSSYHNTEKTPEYKYYKNGAAGLFSASGQKWRSTRKALTPGFKTNVPGANFGDNYSYHIPTFLDTLGKFADDGKEHDVYPVLHLCLLDLLSDNMFDTRMDLQKQNHELARVAEMEAVMIYDRLVNPLIWPNWVYALLGHQKKFDELKNKGRVVIQEVLDQRIKIRNQLKEMDPTAERPQTFMEVLLSNVDSGVITKQDAFEELKELVTSGTLTTSATSGDILWLLSMFPDIQEKAYQEVREVCTGDEITLDDLPNLIYIEMIVKEALRHFTAPLFSRQLVRDLKVNDKITIPAKVRVVLGSWLLHHNPEYWEKPGGFYPEHFSEANERKRPKGAYIPFSSGPRNCPGSKYAMQTLKILIANTLLHYEFSSSREAPKDLQEEKYKLLLLLRPADGHMVQIKRRHPEKTKIVQFECLNAK